MAYFTGTANNPADLLLTLKSHAESIGWITDRSSTDEWCCHNSSGYWSIKAFNDRMELCGNTGFNHSATWDNQPGSSKVNHYSSYKYPTRYDLSAAAFIAYHVFASADYLHLTTEIASGQFRPCFIGTLDKRGAVYSGGHYVCGFKQDMQSGNLSDTSYVSYPFDFGNALNKYYYSSHVRVDGQDGAPSPDWLFFSPPTWGNTPNKAIGLGRGYRSDYHPCALLVETSSNALSGGTLLIPCTIYTVGAENRTRLIGEVPDFRICRMDYLSAGDTVMIGSETWRVFPPFERTALDNQGSGMVGYAYKVVA